MKALLLAFLLLPGAALAANKCVMPNGKVEYMDAPCPSDSKGSAVRTDQNTLPTPDRPSRIGVAAGCTPDPTPVDENMLQCKFPWYSVGDEKGKALSADAKRECLTNVVAKRSCIAGQPSTEAYQRWKDHHDQMVGKRSHRTLNCRPNGYGMTCN